MKKKPVSSYVFKVYGSTLLLGLLLGVITLYAKDKYLNMYYPEWDNPFLNFIAFLFIGIGESIIPILLFYLVTSVVVKLHYTPLFIYTAGFACTLTPFAQFYYMVNEGYHRTNVLIYACCFVIALLFSYWLNRFELWTHYEQDNNAPGKVS